MQLLIQNSADHDLITVSEMNLNTLNQCGVYPELF